MENENNNFKTPIYRPEEFDVALKIGVDFENIASILEKTDLKKRESIHYRIQVLKKHGTIIKTYYNNRSAYWLREDADKIMCEVFFNLRRPDKAIKPISETMRLGVDYETLDSIIKTSKFFNTKREVFDRSNRLKKKGIITTVLCDKEIIYWSKEEANIIMYYRSPSIKRD